MRIVSTAWEVNQFQDVACPGILSGFIETRKQMTPDPDEVTRWQIGNTEFTGNVVEATITNIFDPARVTLPIESCSLKLENARCNALGDDYVAEYDFTTPTVQAAFKNPAIIDLSLGFHYDTDTVETKAITRQRLDKITVSDDDLYVSFEGQSFTSRLDEFIYYGGNYDASGTAASTLFADILDDVVFPGQGGWNYVIGDGGCVVDDASGNPLWAVAGFTYYYIDAALDSIRVDMPIPPVSHREALTMLAAYCGAYLIHRSDGSLHILSELPAALALTETSYQIATSTHDQLSYYEPEYEAYTWDDEAWGNYVGATATLNQMGHCLYFDTSGNLVNKPVLSATITYMATLLSFSGTETHARISAHDTASASPPATEAEFDAAYDARTTVQNDWDNIEAWSGGGSYVTPPFPLVLQEPIKHSAFDGKLLLFVEDFDDRSTHLANNTRMAHTYDSSPSSAPVLTVITGKGFSVNRIYDRPEVTKGTGVGTIRGTLHSYNVADDSGNIVETEIQVETLDAATFVLSHDACEGTNLVLTGANIIGSPTFRTYSTLFSATPTGYAFTAALAGRAVEIGEVGFDKVYTQTKGDVREYVNPLASDPTMTLAMYDAYVKIMAATRYKFKMRDDPAIELGDRMNLYTPAEPTGIQVIVTEIVRSFDGGIDGEYVVIADPNI